MVLFTSRNRAYVIDFKRDTVQHFITAEESIKQLSLAENDVVEVDTGVLNGKYSFVVF